MHKRRNRKSAPGAHWRPSVLPSAHEKARARPEEVGPALGNAGAWLSVEASINTASKCLLNPPCKGM